MVYGDYQLRYAAGCYWLITMYQKGTEAYQSPISLNEAGAQIWKLAEAGRTVPQIAAELEKEYGVSRQEAQEDVLDFLGTLRDRGMEGLPPEI